MVVVVVGWLDIGDSMGIERFFVFCAKKKSLIFSHSFIEIWLTSKVAHIWNVQCDDLIQFFFVRTLKIYSLSKFYLCNTVLLTIVTMLYIRFLELIHLNWNFEPPDQHPISCTPYPLSMTILLCFYEFDFYF